MSFNFKTSICIPSVSHDVCGFPSFPLVLHTHTSIMSEWRGTDHHEHAFDCWISDVTTFAIPTLALCPFELGRLSLENALVHSTLEVLFIKS